MTPDEFGAKIKAKYPDYADMDNTELSRRIVAKHPDYASQVDFGDATNDAPAEPSKSLGPVADTILGAARLLNPVLSMTPDRLRGQAQGAERALLTNEPTHGFGEALLRGAPATVGGILGGTVGAPVGGAGSVPGAALGGAAGEGVRQTAAQLYSAATGREFATPGQVVGNMGIQGVLQGGGQMLGNAAKMVGEYVAPTAQRVGAQAMRIFTGIPEKEGVAALRDPSILSRALPVDEAGAAYGQATGGLKSGAEGSRLALGKSHFSGEAIADKFDEMAASIADGTIDPQTALAMRQQTMKAINDLPYNQRGLSRVLSKNVEELDKVLEAKLPTWEGAKTGFRESKIAESFNSWLPLNKNQSPNVLRSVLASREALMGGAALAGAATGSPMALAALPLISPKVWGAGIRAMGTAGQIPAAVYRVGTAGAAGAGGSALADAYMRQQVAR